MHAKNGEAEEEIRKLIVYLNVSANKTPSTRRPVAVS
jgi:hypothetical protein